ncbi:alpha/beta fold hydrolase [Paraburkholderia sp. BR10923]|uniref:alpha/beta fold hydrolase n=1 Tax=Paraburkholderia sp. BR10923 TaxID=3236992 RepID=UPI0034CE1A83
MINYATYGRGPLKAIALHGLFDTRQSFQPMMAGLDPERWSIAVPDLRGYGDSVSVAGPFNMATAASDALELADQLGWERFSVIGHSMCGKVALRLAVDAPERIERLVGLSPVWAGAVPFDADSLAFFRSSAEIVETRQAIIAQSTGNRLPGFWARQLAESSFANSRKDAYAGYLESFAFDDFEAKATVLDQPVLVIVGAQDVFTTKMARVHWLAKLRQVELVVLPDCGHWPVQEVPLYVAALIETFLSK